MSTKIAMALVVLAFPALVAGNGNRGRAILLPIVSRNHRDEPEHLPFGRTQNKTVYPKKTIAYCSANPISNCLPRVRHA